MANDKFSVCAECGKRFPSPNQFGEDLCFTCKTKYAEAKGGYVNSDGHIVLPQSEVK